jgi:hypothetical protein
MEPTENAKESYKERQDGELEVLKVNCEKSREKFHHGNIFCLILVDIWR